MINDEAITGDVIAALAASPDVRATGMRVHTAQGHVRLVGVVDTIDQKTTATQIALHVPGVKAVESDLAVASDGDISNLELQREEEEQFAEEGLSAGARVNEGTVFLEGVVQSVGDEKKAIEVAGSVQGVREVVSDLQIAARRPRDDIGLVDDVAEALSNDPRLEILRLEVRSKDGEVSLYGEVRDSDQKSIATGVAESVPGVKRVENHLKLHKPAF
jgi:osmotically-inducible protein OsmY